MSWTRDLVEGVAVFAAAAGIGTYDPDLTVESLTSEDRLIVLGPLMSKPDVQIGLVAYNTQPDVALADVTQPIQFTLRGDPVTVDAIADDIFNTFEGRVNLNIGGIDITLIHLFSDVPNGLDQEGRALRHLNYYFDAMRQTASRLD